MRKLKIFGNHSPEVGIKEQYSIGDFFKDSAVMPSIGTESKNPFEDQVKWSIWVKTGIDWKKLTQNNKTGATVDYTFFQQSLKRKAIRMLVDINGEKAVLDIEPKPTKHAKIVGVQLLDANYEAPKRPFAYNDTIIVRVNCVDMELLQVLVTLWEDDGGKNDKDTRNLKIDIKKGNVINGKADVAFKLDASYLWLANARQTKGGEGEFHEYYVTAEIFEKVSTRAISKNVNATNPDYKPEEKRPIPAEQKGPSKKQERGIAETVGKMVHDWFETAVSVLPEVSTFNPIEIISSYMTVFIPDVNEEKKDNCVCKESKLYWGKYFTCQERKKIFEISKRLNCKPDYLTSAMALETGAIFDPSIVNSLGYTGLIQIGAAAAEDINRRKRTNITAGSNGNLKDMSKFEQLTYVEYYLEPYKGKLNTLADFYLAILMPIDCGKGNQTDHIVFDRDIVLDYENGKVVKNIKWVRKNGYARNQVFHKEGRNEDGKTYVWEIKEEIEKWYKKGESNKVSDFLCNVENNEEENSQLGQWHDPVDNPRLTKYNYSGIIKPSSGTYGWCRRNSDGSRKYHSGFDFFAIPGRDKVYACLKGNVHQVRYSPSAGWIVRIKIQNVKDLLEKEKKVSYNTQFTDELRGIDIQETDEVFFIYMHLDSTVVTDEDAHNKKEVDAGTVLGYAGVSGSIASGGKAPHLHLEIATVLDAYGHGESVRTNPARFVKLNPYDTSDQDQEARIRHFYNN